jgi:hypothetical protein
LSVDLAVTFGPRFRAPDVAGSLLVRQWILAVPDRGPRTGPAYGGHRKGSVIRPFRSSRKEPPRPDARCSREPRTPERGAPRAGDLAADRCACAAWLRTRCDRNARLRPRVRRRSAAVRTARVAPRRIARRDERCPRSCCAPPDWLRDRRCGDRRVPIAHAKWRRMY